MMTQYLETKKQYPDCILFYRLGDFYEMFFEDALTASRELEITLTGKDCGLEERAPMCGVPYHALEGYLSKLVQKGYKVAIGEQVEEAMRIHSHFSARERKEKALQMMKNVELPNPELLYDKYPHQLSGGMRQRVMIAAALVMGPKLLIADEPTTALDVTIQAQILKLLQKINREQGTAILFISHDLGVIRHLCSRVIVMNRGKAVEQGSVQEIFEHPSMEYTKKLLAAIPTRRTSLRRRSAAKQERGGA